MDRYDLLVTRRHARVSRPDACVADLAIRDGRIAAVLAPGTDAGRGPGHRRDRPARAAGRHRRPLASPRAGLHPQGGHRHAPRPRAPRAASRPRSRCRTSTRRPNSAGAAGRDVRAVPRAGDRRLEHQRGRHRAGERSPSMATMGIAAFKVFMVVDTGRSYPHMPGIGVHDHGKLLEIFETIAPTGVPLMVHPARPAADGPHRARLLGSRRARRSAPMPGRTPPTTASSGTPPRRCCCASSWRPERRSTCCTRRRRASSSRSGPPRRAASDVSRGDQPVGRLPGQRLGDDRAPRLVRAVLLGSRGEHGAALGGAPRRHHRPRLDRPRARTPARRRSRAGPTAGRPTPGRRRPSSTCPLLLDAARRGADQPRARRGRHGHRRRRASSASRRKGRLEVGADADIAIVDLERELEIRDDVVLSKIGWTPYAGRTVRGAIETHARPRRGRLRGRTGRRRSRAGAGRPDRHAVPTAIGSASREITRTPR